MKILNWIRATMTCKDSLFVGKNKSNSLLWSFNKQDIWSTGSRPELTKVSSKHWTVTSVGMVEVRRWGPVFSQVTAPDKTVKQKPNPDLVRRDFSQKDSCNSWKGLIAVGGGVIEMESAPFVRSASFWKIRQKRARKNGYQGVRWAAGLTRQLIRKGFP